MAGMAPLAAPGLRIVAPTRYEAEPRRAQDPGAAGVHDAFSESSYEGVGFGLGFSVLLTQLTPSSTFPIRRELRVLTYAALVD
jgi:hypothetical protein